MHCKNSSTTPRYNGEPTLLNSSLCLLGARDSSELYDLSGILTRITPYDVLQTTALCKGERTVLRMELDVVVIVRAPYVIALKISILNGRSRRSGLEPVTHFVTAKQVCSGKGRAVVRGANSCWSILIDYRQAKQELDVRVYLMTDYSLLSLVRYDHGNAGQHVPAGDEKSKGKSQSCQSNKNLVMKIYHMNVTGYGVYTAVVHTNRLGMTPAQLAEGPSVHHISLHVYDSMDSAWCQLQDFNRSLDM